MSRHFLVAVTWIDFFSKSSVYVEGSRKLFVIVDHFNRELDVTLTASVVVIGGKVPLISTTSKVIVPCRRAGIFDTVEQLEFRYL